MRRTSILGLLTLMTAFGMMGLASTPAASSSVDRSYTYVGQLQSGEKPYTGQAEALSQAMQAAHGMGWPVPGRMTGRKGARAMWFGREMALLIGPEPDPGLAAHAALVDQSDAWAVLLLEGPGAAQVLARLCPLDLRDQVFKRGHVARTEVAHMAGAIARMGADNWRIMVFRSMVGTLIHEAETAMRRVAARRNSPV